MRYLIYSLLTGTCLITAVLAHTWGFLFLTVMFAALAIKSLPAGRPSPPNVKSEPPAANLPLPAPYCAHHEYSLADQAILNLRPGQNVRYQDQCYIVDEAITVADFLGKMPLMAQHWFKLTARTGQVAWLTAAETNYRVLDDLMWLVPCEYDGPLPSPGADYVQRGALVYTLGMSARCPYFRRDDYLGQALGWITMADYRADTGREAGLRFLSIDGKDVTVFKFQEVPVGVVTVSD